MRQLAPLVHTWSQYVSAHRRNANGHFLQPAAGAAGVLVDPVPFNDGDEQHVRDLGGVAAIVVTQPDRLAAALHGRDVLGGTLFVPAGLTASDGAAPTNAERMEVDQGLPAGLHVAAIVDAPPGRPTGVPASVVPAAVALYHGPSGSGYVGGAVAGAPAGGLSLLLPSDSPGESAAVHDEARAAAVARSLRRLLAFFMRRILVAEGEPVLADASRVLQDLAFRHDPAACILRPDELVWQPPRAKGSRFERRSAECARLLGLRTLDYEVTLVPPGKQNTLLHRHASHEELFIILEGEGELLTERGGRFRTLPVRAGDALGFPPRSELAHAIRNSGQGDLRMFSFGAHLPDEPAGIAEYPESGKQLQWLGPGRARTFYLPDDLSVDYWAGERLD